MSTFKFDRCGGILLLTLQATSGCSSADGPSKDGSVQSNGGQSARVTGGTRSSADSSTFGHGMADTTATANGGASNASTRLGNGGSDDEAASRQGSGSGGAGSVSASNTKSPGPAATGGKSGQAGTEIGGSAADANAKGLTLYYIRHGEVVANTVDQSEITFENSDQLTELGLRQIDALTTYLQDSAIQPDAVLVSPFKRTQNTIAPFLEAEDLKGEIWMELAECCNRTPTGAALPTVPTYNKYLKATIESDNLTFKDSSVNTFWQTDTYEQGLFMVVMAKTEFLARYGQSGKTVIMVGHASAGQVMIGLLRGDDLTNGPTTSGKNAVFLYNTGVTKLTQDPSTGLFKLDGQNINKPQTK